MTTGIDRREFLARLGVTMGAATLGGPLADLPVAGPAMAADEPAKGSLPGAFSKTVPEDAADLLAIQKHVQVLVKQLRPATVGVRIGAAQGSGVIVTKDGYVLTAGHVSGRPGQNAEIILADGKKLKAKSLGRNRSFPLQWC